MLGISPDAICVVPPFGFFQRVLQEEEFEPVEEEFFGNCGEESLDGEHEELAIFLIFENIVRFYCHSFDNHFDPAVEQVLLVLQALSLVSLGGVEFGFGDPLGFFLETPKHIAMGFFFGDENLLLRDDGHFP